MRKDLLRPDRPTLDRGDAYRFRHLLLRDAAYERLPKSTRAELHERFARWLDERATNVAERDHLVGYHLEQAYRYRLALGPVDAAAQRLAVEAADRLEAAGRREMRRMDLAGAIELLDRASALVPWEKPDVPLELGVAASMLMCGRPADAVARATATVETASRVGDRVGAMQANLARLGFAVYIGASGLQDLQRELDAAFPVFEEAGDESALAWGWWARLQIAHNACRFGDGLEAAVKATAYAERSSDPFLVSHVGHATAQIAMGPTPIPRALEMLEELRGRRVGYDPWIDMWRATLLGELGRGDEAWSVHQQVMEAFLDRGMLLAIATAHQSTWEIAMAAGDVDAAVAAGYEGCAELERMGERGWMSTNAAQLAEALYLVGKHDEAQEWAERAIDIGDPDDAITQAQATMVLALLSAARGEASAARQAIEDVLRITGGMQAPQAQGEAAMHAATVFSALGDQEAAREQLRRALDLFTVRGSTVYMARAAERLAAIAGSTG